MFCKHRHPHAGWYHNPAGTQELNRVDQKTQAKLAQAQNSQEIMKILEGDDVEWQVRMPCLRHPKNEHGCKLCLGAHLDPKPTRI